MPGNDCAGPSRSAGERLGPSDSRGPRSTVSGSLRRSWVAAQAYVGDSRESRPGRVSHLDQQASSMQPLAWPASGWIRPGLGPTGWGVRLILARRCFGEPLQVAGPAAALADPVADCLAPDESVEESVFQLDPGPVGSVPVNRTSISLACRGLGSYRHSRRPPTVCHGEASSIDLTG
jgi:hypothetical protein